jgi:hypothetical protein
MKFKTVVLIASILIASISACAKVIPPRPFFLERDITVNGAEVPHGMYTLTLESQGVSVRATLWREGQFIATAHGTWVKHSVKYTEDAALLRVNSDGTRALTEIRLAGSAKTIVIDGDNQVLRVAPGSGGSGKTSSSRTIY